MFLDKKESKTKTVVLIFASVLIFSLLPYGIYRYIGWKKWDRQFKLKFSITNVIQTGPQRMALKSEYLCELMGLSQNRPKNLYQFDVQEAESKLLASPLIQRAKVETIAPSTVFIDYAVRQPIALLSDFENVALDREGVAFPLYPFFSPKKLTELYLGIEHIDWNEKLEGEGVDLAFSILHLFNRLLGADTLFVKRIDVSNAFAPTLGKREIVLQLEEDQVPVTLRMTPKNYLEELENYFQIRDRLINEKGYTIDLRLAKMAYVDTNTMDM